MASMDMEEALGITGVQNAAKVLSSKAEDFVNDASVEQMWAMKAVKYAETHFKLLQGCDSLTLRLTRYDDSIFEQFQRMFKGLKLDVLNPDDIKSDEAKQHLSCSANVGEDLVKMITCNDVRGHVEEWHIPGKTGALLITNTDRRTTQYITARDQFYQAFPVLVPEATNAGLWRPFCNQYEGQVNDFNFGTLLRLDTSKDYSEENTMLVPRVQFLAIEIARNRLGLNLVHFQKTTSES